MYALTPFNEANNPREWPVEGHQLTMDHVVYLYNAIYREVKDLPVKVGLGEVDPFYSPGSNCMEWWQYPVQHRGRSGVRRARLHPWA